MKTWNQILGSYGEKDAIRYLQKIGMDFVEKNFRIYGGELDLIMKKNDKFHFIEVKTRTSEDFMKLENILTKGKISKIINTAKYYLKINNFNIWKTNFQIDYLGITIHNGSISRYSYIENITGL